MLIPGKNYPYVTVSSWAGTRKIPVEILYATNHSYRIRLLSDSPKGQANTILSVRKDKVRLDEK